jgi:hypothetical protein
MPLQFWFWLIWALWLLFGGWFWWRPNPSLAPLRGYYFGAYGILAVLVAILGWQVFGNPFHALVR